MHMYNPCWLHTRARAQVVPYDDPDDEDDGWATGICNGKKAFFPLNFTALA